LANYSKRTPEQLKAMSERMSGVNNPMYGKRVVYSPEECKRRSERQMGENNTFYGKHHTEETKARWSDIRSERVGEQTNHWKGGTYVKNHNSSERRFIFREEVIKRDNNTCQMCGVQNEKGMHVHHIDLDNSNNDINNGITLCKYCHESTGLHKKK